MRLVVFGLTVSSSWGNGHATLWRSLCAALHRRGHRIVFFERDVPYYASHRDTTDPPGVRLILYESWRDAERLGRKELAGADVGIVTSYCPDGLAATELVVGSPGIFKIFYDLDAPITLDRLARGEDVGYVGPSGYADFDLVLSYTGGAALEALRDVLGARRTAPLYGSVDPEVHRPVSGGRSADLSYLGTYAKDRQETLERLFLEPARLLPGRRFLLGGSLYPGDFPWRPNIAYIPHVPPADHPAFYCSAGLTLNVTRAAMARMGYCPSGRLFEAAACGTAILSDSWEGLETFFEPGREILVAGSSEEAVRAIETGPEGLARIGRAARERALASHSADCRARDLERILAGGET